MQKGTPLWQLAGILEACRSRKDILNKIAFVSVSFATELAMGLCGDTPPAHLGCNNIHAQDWRIRARAHCSNCRQTPRGNVGGHIVHKLWSKPANETMGEEMQAFC